MTKIFQPKVIQYSESIIKTLIEINFFSDNEIENYDFAKNFLCEKLTEKFIINGLNDENYEFFTEDEFESILQYILAGSILNNLKEKGYIDSYEDDETEELFFLTENGKKYMEELKKSE